MEITKVYKKNSFGQAQRLKTETDLFKSGFRIKSEREINEWNNNKGCCLLILFFPLVFFAREKAIEVVYTSE